MTGGETFAFRPLEHTDLARLVEWLARPHVAAWWPTPEHPEAEFFDDADPVRYFVALRDERAIGLVQLCQWSDAPDEAAAVGARPGEAGIDYLIGEPDLIGQGIGPAMLDAFLTGIVRADPKVIGVRVDVSVDNRRSCRCLEKLGFAREGGTYEVIGEPGPHYVYVLDFTASGS
jgi:aminoglycoside 6'-N-acetyltransferase